MARKRKRRRKGPPKHNNRPKEYRKWTKESMAGAIKCVMDGKMGVTCINRPADQYGVPGADGIEGQAVWESNSRR